VISYLPRFRSPLRGPWLTSVFAAVLLVCLPIVIVTGILDYLAYGPGQSIPGDVGLLALPGIEWPTRPVWLFRVTQGLHVFLGIVLVPVVLAKLWSVLPKLFAWPPVESVRHALERGTLLLLVGSILFEIATGLLNIQYDYAFGFDFYLGHYIGAWVFIGAFAAHVALKLPIMVRGLRARPEEPAGLGLVAPDPDPPTISRRGALALVGGGVGLLGVIAAGQVLDGPARALAFLLPRGRVVGEGANAFPINRTAATAGIVVDEHWRLVLGGTRSFTRAELAALPQHTAALPIACVEGWSTQQTWTGVRLRDLAVLAGVPAPATAFVDSADPGPFGRATLYGGQVTDPDALLALQVNGADLSLDHGFPARIVVPALPGVHCTKWVRSIEFREG
jgi:DMSO/TMAO reductase YedYZ molybdopterin-dependent catalytic subunit